MLRIANCIIEFWGMSKHCMLQSVLINYVVFWHTHKVDLGALTADG